MQLGDRHQHGLESDTHWIRPCLLLISLSRDQEAHAVALERALRRRYDGEGHGADRLHSVAPE